MSRMQFYGESIFDTGAIIRDLRSKASRDVDVLDMTALFGWAYAQYHTPSEAQHHTTLQVIREHVAEYEIDGTLPDYVIGLYWHIEGKSRVCHMRPA